MFTYRLRSPLRLVVNSSDEVASADVPPIRHVTEIFLPQRVYPEGKVDYQLSIGGRMKFDFPNQRAYVWFSDVPAWIDKKKADKIRRIDIWQKGKRPVQDERGFGTWLSLALIVFLAVIAMIYAQRLQWRHDEAVGLKTPNYWI